MKRILFAISVYVLVITLIYNISAETDSNTYFSDISGTEYYAVMVSEISGKGIMNGYSDGTFGAEKNITRAETAAVICRIIGKEDAAKNISIDSPFTDVSHNHWANGYVTILLEEGIISGDGNNLFRPSDNVLYEEAVKMFVCALGYDKYIVPDPTDWKKPYIQAGASYGITDNTTGNPGNYATRGDIAVMAYNTLKNVGNISNGNIKDVTFGYTLNTDGTLVKKEERAVSDFIYCRGKSFFSCSASIAGAHCFYNSDKEFIAFINNLSSKENIPIPEGAYYLRISMPESSAEKQCISFSPGISPEENNAPQKDFQSENNTKNGAYDSPATEIPETSEMITVVVQQSESVRKKSLLSRIIEKPLTIKLIGDSITHGVGGTGFEQNGETILKADDKLFKINTDGYCWANELKNYIENKFEGSSVLNYGVRGHSFHSMQLANFSRLKQLVSKDDGCDVVILMFGTNDRQACKTLDEFKDKAEKVIKYIKDTCGKELILMSSIPASVKNESAENVNFHMEDVDMIISCLAEEHDLQHISLYKEFINHSKIMSKSIDDLLDDGLHPNDEGYSVIFEIVAEKLGFSLKRPGANW